MGTDDAALCARSAAERFLLQRAGNGQTAGSQHFGNPLRYDKIEKKQRLTLISGGFQLLTSNLEAYRFTMVHKLNSIGIGHCFTQLCSKTYMAYHASVCKDDVIWWSNRFPWQGTIAAAIWACASWIQNIELLSLILLYIIWSHDEPCPFVSSWLLKVGASCTCDAQGVPLGFVSEAWGIKASKLPPARKGEALEDFSASLILITATVILSFDSM